MIQAEGFWRVIGADIPRNKPLTLAYINELGTPIMIVPNCMTEILPFGHDAFCLSQLDDISFDGWPYTDPDTFRNNPDPTHWWEET